MAETKKISPNLHYGWNTSFLLGWPTFLIMAYLNSHNTLNNQFFSLAQIGSTISKGRPFIDFIAESQRPQCHWAFHRMSGSDLLVGIRFWCGKLRFLLVKTRFLTTLEFLFSRRTQGFLGSWVELGCKSKWVWNKPMCLICLFMYGILTNHLSRLWVLSSWKIFPYMEHMGWV